jgi:ketosteroid isomerase-like protein
MGRCIRLATVALLLVSAQLPTSAVPAQTGSRQRGERARAALVAAESAYAAASAGGLLSGFAPMLGDDVVLLHPGARVVRGRAEAIAFLRALPDAATRSLTWSPMHVDVSADGTRGYSYGSGTHTVGGTTTGLQYVAYWRRGRDGRWRAMAWLQRAGHDGATRPLPARCATLDGPRVRAATGARAARDDAALLRTDAEFSRLSEREGGAVAFGTYVADDGVLLLGDSSAVACGRDEMRAANASLAPGALTWVPALSDAAPSGDLGMTVGVGALRSGARTFHSKYLTIWKRQRSGDWRFVVDGGNATPPP